MSIGQTIPVIDVYLSWADLPEFNNRENIRSRSNIGC
jgi:hypothetical protein